jgi:hypothetical protein
MDMCEARSRSASSVSAALRLSLSQAHQSHRNPTDRGHGRKLSNSPNATVRDTGDIYPRQHSNRRSTSVLLFKRQNCRFSPLAPRHHGAGGAFRDTALDHSRERLQDSFATPGAVHGTTPDSPGTPFVFDAQTKSL